MPTFTWIPDKPVTETSTPRVGAVELGGYTHRPTYGLNPYRDEWKVSFSGRDTAERNAITDFLTAQGGVEPFEWTTPFNDTAEFVCTAVSTVLDSCKFSTIQATFELQCVPGGLNPPSATPPSSAFTWIPDYTAKKDLDYRPSSINYGDGYTARLRFGLNAQSEAWSLVFNNRTNTERDSIRAYLRAARGAFPITWTDPTTGVTGYYYCSEWSTTFNNHNNSNIQATFVRSFEPLRRDLIPILSPRFTGSYTAAALRDTSTGRGTVQIDTYGNTYHALNYAPPSATYPYPVITKRSPLGEVMWCVSLGEGLVANACAALVIDGTSSYIYVVCSSEYTGSPYNTTLRIHKLNCVSGGLVWSKEYQVPTSPAGSTFTGAGYGTTINKSTGNLHISVGAISGAGSAPRFAMLTISTDGAVLGAPAWRLPSTPLPYTELVFTLATSDAGGYSYLAYRYRCTNGTAFTVLMKFSPTGIPLLAQQYAGETVTLSVVEGASSIIVKGAYLVLVGTYDLFVFNTSTLLPHKVFSGSTNTRFNGFIAVDDPTSSLIYNASPVPPQGADISYPSGSLYSNICTVSRLNPLTGVIDAIRHIQLRSTTGQPPSGLCGFAKLPGREACAAVFVSGNYSPRMFAHTFDFSAASYSIVFPATTVQARVQSVTSIFQDTVPYTLDEVTVPTATALALTYSTLDIYLTSTATNTRADVSSAFNWLTASTPETYPI